MRAYMFRNRWGALLFVAITLAGVVTLVGTEKSKGSLQEASAQISAQRAQAAAFSNSEPSRTEIEAAVVPIEDQELIDPATGIDPVPIDDFHDPFTGEETEVAPTDDVVIVSEDDAGPSGPG